MDGSKPLSLNIMLEVDQAQSMKNVKKAIDNIGKTPVEIKGLDFDLKGVAKDFNRMVNQSFKVDKNNQLTHMTSQLMNQYGQILTIQQRVFENGTTEIQQANLKADALSVQKKRYEEIRQLYEEIGKLQRKSLTANEEKKEQIKEEIKDTRANIREKEKALKKDGMVNDSLKQSVIEKQKLANTKLITQEEEKLAKKRESAYARVIKAWELIHKYNMQSLGASKEEIAVLEKKKALAQKSVNSANGFITGSGLYDKDYQEKVNQIKEIHSLEYQTKKNKLEEIELNKELEKSETYLLKLKKQYASSTDENVKASLNKQIVQQALAIERQKQVIEQQGLSYQQTENALLQKQLEYENQIEVAKAKQLSNAQKEQKAIETLIARTQRDMGINIDSTLAKNSKYITSDDLIAIEQFQQKLRQLDGTSLNNVKNEIADLKLDWKEINSNIQVNKLRQTSSIVEELGKSLKTLTANYISGAIAIDKLWDTLRQGVGYLKELDEAYTDVAISMDVTRREFDNWTTDARKIAQANGLMTTSIMDMVKIYATSGESIAQIQDKLEGTAMIQNITQWDAEKTTSVVNSVINQYKLLEKEINGTTGNVSNAIEYMGDALIGVSNALKVDNVTGIQEIAAAIDEAGGVLEQAGASMEWYMGVTGTLNEVMNATGSEIGNAMKMISARVFAQGQAMEELGESSEKIEMEMRKAEQALTQVGVAIREADNPSQLRNLEDILDDLAGKWDTLTDSTKNYVAEGIAGTNRRNYFISIMENYERVQQLAEAGEKSQGALAEANQRRVESLAGQINIMKDKLMELMTNMHPVIEGGVQLGNTLLDVANKVGGVGTALGLGTGAFLTFNEKGREITEHLVDIAKAMKNVDLTTVSFRNAFKKTENGLIQTKLAMATTTATTLALQTAMAITVSGVVSIATAIGTKLIGAIKDAVPSLEKLEQQVQDTSTSISNYVTATENLWAVKKDMSSIKEMQNKLDNENLSMEEQKELVENINELLANHASNYSSIETVLKNENMPLEERIRLLEREAELQQKISAHDAYKNITQTDMFGNSQFDKIANGINDKMIEYATLIRRMNSEIDGLFGGEEYILEKTKEITDKHSANISSAITDIEAYAIQAKVALSTVTQAFELGIISEAELDKYKAEYETLIATIQDWGTKNKINIDVGIEVAEEEVKEQVKEISLHLDTAKSKLQSLFTEDYDTENIQQAFEDIIEACNGLTDGTKEAKEALKEIKAQFPEMGDEVDTLSEALDYLGAKSMLETREQAENLMGILDELAEGGAEALDTGMMQELLSLYPELASRISDATYVQDFLNDKIAEMQEASNEAYHQMISQDEDYWNTKMKNSSEWANYEKGMYRDVQDVFMSTLGEQEQGFIDYINAKGGLREVDLSNANTLAQAEGTLGVNLVNQLLKDYVAYINGKGGARKTDLVNVGEFLSSQEVAEAQTVQDLVNLWNQYYKQKKAQIAAELKQFNGLIDEYAYAYGDQANSGYDQWKNNSSVKNLINQLHALEKSNGQMTLFLNGIGKVSSSLGNGLKQVTASANKIGKGTGTGVGSSSSSNKDKDGKNEVEDLELEIDRYYELNDALDDVNNALEKNRDLQKKAQTVSATKKLHKEEIDLLNQKLEALKKLQAEQRMDMTEQKNTLKSAGFKFDKEGNLTNYSSRLKELQKYANSLKGEAKEAQIEYVNSIMGVIDAYTSLSNDTIPSTSQAISDLEQEIKDVNEAHKETLKLIDAIGDRYYEINGLITDVDNKLELNQAKQQNASGAERVKLMQEEIDLMKEKQRLLVEQGKEAQKEANDIQKQLADKGVKFNKDGTVANYKNLADNYKNRANGFVGDARDKVIEEWEELQDLIEQYDDIVRDVLPNLEVEWEEYANSISEAEKAMAEHVTQVQKDITSAIQNELQKRTDAVKSELQKQKDAYNEQFEQEDWEDSLASEQRKLDEIQQQMNALSRDTSMAGQLKLQQLRAEYEAQQKVINDMIRDHEKEEGNKRFDEEMAEADKTLEEALDPKNVADLVNKALVDGFVTIGDEVVALDTLMTDWLSETGDGLYAIGDTLREELIDNLRTAQQLMADMGVASVGVSSSVSANALLSNLGESLNASLTSSVTKGSSPMMELSIGSLLQVDGNVTEDVMPKLESLLEQAKTEIIDEIASELTRR